MTDLLQTLGTYIDLIIVVAIGLIFLGIIVTAIMTIPPLQGARKFFQGDFSERYLGMRVSDNAIIHEVEYKVKGASIPLLGVSLGILPLKCDEDLFDIRANLELQHPPFQSLQVNEWKFENNLGKFLRTNHIKPKPENCYRIKYHIPLAGRQVFELDRIAVRRSENSEQFEEEFIVRLRNPFNHAENVVVDIPLPVDSDSEDVVSIEVWQNGQRLDYRAYATLSRGFHINGVDNFPLNGIRDQNIYMQHRPNLELSIQQISIPRESETRIVMKKRMVE